MTFSKYIVLVLLSITLSIPLYSAHAVGLNPSTPVITSPIDTDYTSPVTVQGTCEVGSIVYISGFATTTVSTLCTASSTFSVSIASTTASGSQSISVSAAYAGWATTTDALADGFGAHNFVANGYLYSLNGYETPDSQTYRALIGANGTLGAWANVTSTTTYDAFGQYFGSALFTHNRIFVIAGVGSFGFERLTRVRSAPINESNVIGSWADEPQSLPAPQWYFGMIQHGDYVYTVGGIDNSFAVTNTVNFTSIAGDGHMNAWATTTPLPIPLAAPNVVVLDNKLYVLGGKSAQYANATSTVFHADINIDGTLGAWQRDADLPFVTSLTSTANSAHIDGDYVYILGTGDGKGTYYAPIIGSTTIGTWQAGPALRQVVQSQTVLHNGYFYELGRFEASPANMVEYISTSSLRVAGNASASTTKAFTIDNTIPTLTSVTGYTNNIVLTYSKSLPAIVPATSTFSVSINGTTTDVSSVQINARVVTLTLPVSITYGQTVLVSYTVPVSNPIQDGLGHEALGFSSTTVSIEAPASTGGARSSGGGGGGSSSGYVSYVNPVKENVSTTTEKNATSTIYTRDLKLGSNGLDVKNLQMYLNNHGFIISRSGIGAPGKETVYFGIKTKLALMRFQKAYGIKPNSGYFGEITRKLLNSLPY